MQSLGGFDARSSDFLSTTRRAKALSFHLKKSFDGAQINLPLNVGDQLEADTGIVGLSTTGAAGSPRRQPA